MQRTHGVAAVFFLAACGAAQTVSPREIFYGQGRTGVPQKAAGTPAKPKPGIHKTPAVPDSPASVQPAPQPVESAPDSPTVELISNKVAPLGLKYIVLKRGSGGEYAEVDPESNFVAGDRIKLTLEVNDTGYLYVVAQGSSGIWKVLYPSAELNGGDNRVRAGRTYSIPNEAVFTFDSRTGAEKLFLVLSRQPERDLENLIYSLQGKDSRQGEISRPLIASNVRPVQDDVVQRLRQTYSRDLLIEKVDDSKTAPPEEVKKLEHKQGVLIVPGEKAVYVVNRNAGPDASVVADVELKHR